MQIITLNIKDRKTSNKVLWLLKQLEDEGVEIIDKENLRDLKLLAATRKEKSIPFDEYMKSEDLH